MVTGNYSGRGNSGSFNHLNELIRWCLQYLRNIPSLFSSRLDDRAQGVKILQSLHCPETSRDFLPYPGHSQIPFCLIIRKRDSKIMKKEQYTVSTI